MGGTPKELIGRSLVWILVRKENHHADAGCAILPTAFPYRKVGECVPLPRLGDVQPEPLPPALPATVKHRHAIGY